jgi:septum formation protein
VTRPPSTALLLASGSTGRLAVLRAAGIDPEVLVSGVDETCDESMDTAAMVAELAERKASAVAALRPEALILGCDSLLDFEGEAVGKAGTPERAAAVWRRLAGNQGTLYTGHCLIEGSSGRRARAVTATTVRFGVPAEAELAAYIASGEPLAVAGAFTIDGLGGPFVDRIDGDPSNVVGLSLPTLRRLLAELGIAITDLWAADTRLRRSRDGADDTSSHESGRPARNPQP